MSFYTYLQSNVVDEIGGGENTCARFKTKLPQTLRLDKSWSVGLTSVSFTNSILNTPDSKIYYTYSEIGARENLPSLHSTDSVYNEITNMDTDQSENKWKELEGGQNFKLCAGYYPTPLSIVNKINDIIQTCADHFHTDWDPLPCLVYNGNTNKVSIVSGKIKSRNNQPIFIRFDKQIESQLGLEHIEWNSLSEHQYALLRIEAEKSNQMGETINASNQNTLSYSLPTSSSNRSKSSVEDQIVRAISRSLQTVDLSRVLSRSIENVISLSPDIQSFLHSDTLTNSIGEMIQTGINKLTNELKTEIFTSDKLVDNLNNSAVARAIEGRITNALKEVLTHRDFKNSLTSSFRYALTT